MLGFGMFPIDMALQGPFPRGPVVTEATLEGFLPRVGSLVAHEVVLRVENPVAVGAPPPGCFFLAG